MLRVPRDNAEGSNLRSPLKTIGVAGIGLFVTAALISACSSSPSTSASKSTTTTSKTKSTKTTRPSTTTFPTYQNNDKLRPDVITNSCVASAGGWSASGRIHSTQKDQHLFILTVYFTNAHSTVLGAGKTSISVKAAGTKPWKITAKFSAPPGTLCVLVGVN